MATEEYINMLKSEGLVVGSNFNMQEELIIDRSHIWLIEIGDNVTLAPRVHILAHDASTKKQLGYTKLGRVRIGNNVFIGASTIVLPNVKIGNKVIVGAGSVVSKDIPENSVAVGNPARVISTYDEYMAKNKKQMEEKPLFGSEYTIKGGITEEMKQEQKEKLDKTIGYVV